MARGAAGRGEAGRGGDWFGTGARSANQGQRFGRAWQGVAGRGGVWSGTGTRSALAWSVVRRA